MGTNGGRAHMYMTPKLKLSSTTNDKGRQRGHQRNVRARVATAKTNVWRGRRRKADDGFRRVRRAATKHYQRLCLWGCLGKRGPCRRHSQSRDARNNRREQSAGGIPRSCKGSAGKRMNEAASAGRPAAGRDVLRRTRRNRNEPHCLRDLW